MNLAEKIEEGRVSLQVITGMAKQEGPHSLLSKYDPLIDVLSDSHQLVLGVLKDVSSPDFEASTPVPQEVLDSIYIRGSGLLRTVDRDMLTLVSERGNFNGNAVYSSLVKLRQSLEDTIRNYSRLVGSV